MSDILALIAYLQFSIGQLHFRGFAFFCNFVRNRIYVMEIEVLGPVVLARYSKKRTGYNFCDTILPYLNIA